MPVTISGGIFNFTDGSYIAPTYSGSIYNFINPLVGVKQVYIDANYTYVISDPGLTIFDTAEELAYAYINYLGVTSITGNDDYIYLGTTSSGLRRLNKTCISGSILTPYDISDCLYDYITYPYIEDESITYLHANGDYLGLITTSGTVVKAAKIDNQGYVSAATISGGITATKCYMTTAGLLYYVVSGTEWSVDRTNTLSAWSTPDISYLAGGSILATSIIPTDIYVTEGTSSDGTSNTLFITTTSGTYIIDEGTNNHIVYLTGSGTSSGTSYFILHGTNIFASIWADPTTSLTNGKFYITNSDSLHVINNNQNVIHDYYSSIIAGRTEETLDYTDIVDIGADYGI